MGDPLVIVLVYQIYVYISLLYVLCSSLVWLEDGGF